MPYADRQSVNSILETIADYLRTTNNIIKKYHKNIHDKIHTVYYQQLASTCTYRCSTATDYEIFVMNKTILLFREIPGAFLCPMFWGGMTPKYFEP